MQKTFLCNYLKINILQIILRKNENFNIFLTILYFICPLFVPVMM